MQPLLRSRSSGGSGKECDLVQANKGGWHILCKQSSAATEIGHSSC